jgi:hypothetical protein
MRGTLTRMGYWAWRRAAVALLVLVCVLADVGAAHALAGAVLLLTAGAALRARTLRQDYERETGRTYDHQS